MSDAASPALEAFALERWFASQAMRAHCDLTGSGASPITLREVLALASERERRAFDDVSLGYGPGEGSHALRAAIAARYDDVGAEDVSADDVSADDVLVTCGAIEALHLAVSALVRPGDEVIVQDPMYPAVAGLARARGARVVLWPLRAERGYHPSLDDLERLLSPRTRLVAITQPNGPTGSVLDAAELDELCARLAPRDVWLLSDEVYRDLVLEPGLRVATVAGRTARAIAVGDLGKPFGLGGLRVGWLASGDGSLRGRISARRDYTTLSPPTPSDVLARIALAHAAQLLRPPLAHARTNLDALSALAGTALSFTRPRAGVTAFVGVPEAGRVQRRLADEGVLVVPGSLFGHPDRLRIGLAVPGDTFSFGLDRLAAIVAS